jgi:hypothetical protein
MSPVQIVTLVVVCAIVSGSLLVFLIDLWKMRKALDRAQPVEPKPRPKRTLEAYPRSSRNPSTNRDRKKDRFKVIK